MTKFMINNRTDALKTNVNLLRFNENGSVVVALCPTKFQRPSWCKKYNPKLESDTHLLFSVEQSRPSPLIPGLN